MTDCTQILYEGIPRVSEKMAVSRMRLADVMMTPTIRNQVVVTKPAAYFLCSLQWCKRLNVNHQPTQEPNYHHSPFHPVSTKASSIAGISQLLH